MVSFSFLAISFFLKAMAFIWLLCALALIFIILIQKGKGGGLSGAFGGGMASSVLGANAKKPLTWFTIGLVSFFLLIAVLLARFYKPSISETGITEPATQTQPTGEEQSAVPAADIEQPTVPAPGQDKPGATTPAGGPTSATAADANSK